MSTTNLHPRLVDRLALVAAFVVVIVVVTDPPFASAQQQSSQPQAAQSRGPEPPALQSRPPRDTLDYVTQIVAPIGILLTLITINMNVRNWKWTYFTKEWSTLMQFLHSNAKFMDPSKTVKYKTEFIGDDAMKYELIARLCIAYLDDLYFLGSKRELLTWFRGSIKLFAGTHRAWLEDHRDSYDRAFFDFIQNELPRAAN